MIVQTYNFLDVEIAYSEITNQNINEILSVIKTGRGDANDLVASSFVVAKDGEIVIGCVRTKNLSADCIELSSLVVLPQYRGKGIGSELVKRVLKKDARRPVYLLCMKSKENFYKNLGFVSIEKDLLPEILLKEYIRVAEKLGELKSEIITMAIFN